MGRMTIHVSDELMNRLRKEHPDINWAEVARNAVTKKIKQLKELRGKGLI